MERLDHISIDDLHSLKHDTRGEIPRERVLAAIGRKQGDTIARLAERHDVCPKTVRNWLDRFVDQPVENAPYDDRRSGRLPRLSDEQRAELFDDFSQSPTELGYSSTEWTASLGVHHIETTFGIAYSSRHVRNLLQNANSGA